jgi:hypothetical protein
MKTLTSILENCTFANKEHFWEIVKEENQDIIKIISNVEYEFAFNKEFLQSILEDIYTNNGVKLSWQYATNFFSDIDEIMEVMDGNKIFFRDALFQRVDIEEDCYYIENLYDGNQEELTFEEYKIFNEFKEDLESIYENIEELIEKNILRNSIPEACNSRKVML